jgi:hypothetical protein
VPHKLYLYDLVKGPLYSLTMISSKFDDVIFDIMSLAINWRLQFVLSDNVKIVAKHYLTKK